MGRIVVLCRLRQLMDASGVTFIDLKKGYGLNNDQITALRANSWTKVSRKTMEILCDRFRVTPGDLFVCISQDLWFPATGKSADVHLHVGQRSVGAQASHETEVMFCADVHACNVVGDHLKSRGVSGVRMVGHSMGLTKEPIAPLRTGVHVIVGSPNANPLTAPAIRDFLYQVAPSTPTDQLPFPFRMAWSNGLTIGYPTLRADEIGISAGRTGGPVAYRRALSDDRAEDCALLFARRFPVSKEARFEDDSRVVVVVCGHGAAGTTAGAIAAIRDDVTAAMFPLEFGTVTAAVIGVEYDRPKRGSSEAPRLEPQLLQVVDTIVEGEFAGISTPRDIRAFTAGAS